MSDAAIENICATILTVAFLAFMGFVLYLFRGK